MSLAETNKLKSQTARKNKSGLDYDRLAEMSTSTPEEMEALFEKVLNEATHEELEQMFDTKGVVYDEILAARVAANDVVADSSLQDTAGGSLKPKPAEEPRKATGPPSRGLHLSVFRSAKDNRPAPRVLTLSGFPRHVETEHKGSSGAFSPVTYLDGTTRGNKNVAAINALVADIDKATKDQVEKVLEAVEPFQHLVYSTHSHDAQNNNWCLRLLVALESPLAPSQYPDVWRRFNALVGRVMDQQTADPARIYYFPEHPPGASPIFSYGPGRQLRLSDLPAQSAALALAPSNAIDATPTALDRGGFKKIVSKLKPEHKEIGKRFLNCEKHAEEGDRDGALHRFLSAFIWRCPTVETKSLVAHLMPSLSHWDEDFKPTEKIERIKARVQAELAEKRRGWQGQLTRSVNRDGVYGKPYSSVGNLMVLLRHHPEMEGVLSYNDRLRAAVLDRNKTPWVCTGLDEQVSDRDIAEFAKWSERTLNVSVSVPNAAQAIEAVARDRCFDPVHDRLDTLVWEGTPRLDTWLVDYAGAADTPLNRAFSAKTLIQAVRGVYEPGCKADYVTVLEGPQGAGKSSLVRTLALEDEWFGDDMPDISSDKEAKMWLEGIWIAEIAELDSMKRAEATATKKFITTTTDQYRPSYGRKKVREPRRCVFIGTTNTDSYINDATGGRRFWPVAVGKINLDGLRDTVEQLWAEAVHRYKSGEPAWIDNKKLAKQATEAQSDRYAEHPWTEAVRGYLRGKEGVSTTDVARWLLKDPASGFDVAVGKVTRSHEMQVADILKRLGWRKVTKKGRVTWQKSAG